MCFPCLVIYFYRPSLSMHIYIYIFFFVFSCKPLIIYAQMRHEVVGKSPDGSRWLVTAPLGSHLLQIAIAPRDFAAKPSVTQAQKPSLS